MTAGKPDSIIRLLKTLEGCAKFVEFTYSGYRNLLALLRGNGYAFADYQNWTEKEQCVILRHDIDNSLPDAARLGRLEADEGVRSTWFVLLRTDFYNPASAASSRLIRELHSMGHEIGLHFDEVAYASAPECQPGGGVTVDNILREARILSDICGFPIRAVSMHRPSRRTLDANYDIPGMVNSYGKTFFQDFKYLSDSRRRWREPAEDIIRARQYKRLHILTHAFWYRETPEGIADTVGRFIRTANRERYAQMNENLTDLPSVLKESEV